MTSRILVSASRLQRALDEIGSEAVAEQVAEAPPGAPTGDEATAAQLLSFQEAVEAIADAETGDGLFSAPRHAMASALQSYLAEKSLEAGKTEPLVAGGEEAK